MEWFGFDDDEKNGEEFWRDENSAFQMSLITLYNEFNSTWEIRDSLRSATIHRCSMQKTLFGKGKQQNS